MESAISGLSFLRYLIVAIGFVAIIIFVLLATKNGIFIFCSVGSGFLAWFLYSFLLGFTNIVQASEIYIKKNLPEDSKIDE